MAKRPSHRTHRSRPDDTLNLTPLIDMITCLMFFLLLFAGILPVAMIDAPLPKIASTAEEVKQAKDTSNKLELTVYISARDIRVKSDAGGERTFAVGADGKLPTEQLHKYLVELHARRPNSHDITLMPADDTSYDMLIQVMDASRELIKDDAGYQPVPPEIANKPESTQFNRLFSDVSLGGV